MLLFSDWLIFQKKLSQRLLFCISINMLLFSDWLIFPKKKIKLNCEKLIDNDNDGFKVKTWIIGTDKQKTKW
jgi:hypothetical protein